MSESTRPVNSGSRNWLSDADRGKLKAVYKSETACFSDLVRISGLKFKRRFSIFGPYRCRFSRVRPTRLRLCRSEFILYKVVQSDMGRNDKS